MVGGVGSASIWKCRWMDGDIGVVELQKVDSLPLSLILRDIEWKWNVIGN